MPLENKSITNSHLEKDFSHENILKTASGHILKIQQYQKTDYPLSAPDIEHVLNTTLRLVPICTFKGFIFKRYL